VVGEGSGGNGLPGVSSEATLAATGGGGRSGGTGCPAYRAQSTAGTVVGEEAGETGARRISAATLHRRWWGRKRRKGLPGIKRATLRHGGGGGAGNGLPGVSSAATLPPPVVGGGAGKGLPAYQAQLHCRHRSGRSGENGAWCRKAEETMVAARKVPKITVQIFGK